MKRKRIPLWTVALYALTSIIWLVNCMLTFSQKTLGSLFSIQLLCALIWAAGFFILLHRYRKERQSRKE